MNTIVRIVSTIVETELRMILEKKETGQSY